MRGLEQRPVAYNAALFEPDSMPVIVRFASSEDAQDVKAMLPLNLHWLDLTRDGAVYNPAVDGSLARHGRGQRQ